MNQQRVVCDFFLEVNGEEHICEIYDTDDTYVIDCGVYPLLEDGSKGEPILEPNEEIDKQVNDYYYDWVMNRRIDDCF